MLLKFESVKKKLTGISRGVRQANISNKDILNLSVPIPPIELQNEFAAFVVQVDKSKVVKQNPQSERRISLWKSIFRS
jgi:type I restriction enzyme S subunit